MWFPLVRCSFLTALLTTGILFISVMLLLCIVKDEFVERKKDDVRQISASVVFTIPTLFQRDQYRLLVRESSDGHIRQTSTTQ